MEVPDDSDQAVLPTASRGSASAKEQEAACALITQRGKVSFFCRVLNKGTDLVGQGDLGRDIPTIVRTSRPF